MLNETTIILRLTAWLLYLVVQSLFIHGIKLALYGKTEILPDESTADHGMILYPFYKFMTQSIKRKVFFQGQQLVKISNEIRSAFPSIAMYSFEHGSFLSQASNIEKQFNLKVSTDNSITQFYREINFYKFPEWIRKPTVECVVCMASFWGMFTCFFPALALYGFNLPVIVFFVCNTVLLATVNAMFNKLI